MAADGIRFDNAFVTAPVCSSSRSAMVSGMYQMTLGAHNHRSQTTSGKVNLPRFCGHEQRSLREIIRHAKNPQNL